MNISDIVKITRINSPTGSLLLFWPCAFASCLVSQEIDVLVLLEFLIASFLARSAGCIVNDIIDKEIDAQVERTQNRPLANGSISLNEAFILLGLICGAGFVLMLATLNYKAILICIFGGLLVSIYPFMKRFTNFPQIFLGITFNLGAIVTGVQMEGTISIKILLLYISCVFWTTTYDTIYGFMDIKDDRKIGVKSLSLYLEQYNPKFWIMLFYMTFLMLFYISVYIAKSGINLLQIILGFSVLCYFTYQLLVLDVESQEECFEIFDINNFIALALLIVTMV